MTPPEMAPPEGALLQESRGGRDLLTGPGAGKAGPSVFLVTESFPPYYGGGGMRFRRYLPGLRDRGIDVRVLTSRPSGWKGEIASPERPGSAASDGGWVEERVDGAPVLRYAPSPADGPRTRRLRFAAAVDRVCREHEPDVLQLVSVPLEGLPWIGAARLRGTRVVYTETMVPEPGASLLGRLRRRLRAMLVSGGLDGIIASSGVMRDGLVADGFRGRIEVIPNGVDLTRFRPPEDAEHRRRIRRELDLPADGRMVLYLGGVSPRKGIDRLLEAWAVVAREAPDARLVIAGPRRDLVDPGLDSFRRRVAHLVESSGAADRIHFTGFVPDPERYLRAADLFVFASHREGMGNVVLEAMATAVPVVLTPYAGLPEEFGTAGTHYALAGDGTGDPTGDRGAGLGEVVARILADPDAAGRMGEAGRALVESGMSMEHSLDRYARLYREMARG